MKMKSAIASRSTRRLGLMALATLVSAPALVVPMTASAGLTGAIGIANMYLWRGQNVSDGAAQVFGDLKYTHESGLFADLWTSTGEEPGGHETDIVLGYTGKTGEFGYGIAYWEIMYPESVVANTGDGADFNSITDTDVQELQLTASYGPVAVNYYYGLDVPVSGDGNVDSASDENNYLTIAGTMGQFTALYGMWDLESDAADEYSHLMLTYAATPELALGVNFTFSDKEDADGNPLTEEGPLFYASYTWSFDLAKK